MRKLGITIAAVIGLLLGWYERSHAQFAADAKPAPREVVVVRPPPRVIVERQPEVIVRREQTAENAPQRVLENWDINALAQEALSQAAR